MEANNILVNIISLIYKFISGEALLILLVFGVYIFCVVKNTKINIMDIIKRHLKTLKDYSTKKTSKKDILTFFIVPAIFAICLTNKCTVTNNGVQIVLTVFSIFAGLMFNLLILIMDIGRRVRKQGNEEKVDAKRQKITEQLILETYTNVAFSILVSLFVICITLVFVIGLSNIIIKYIISIILYWLVIVFIMTLFMILKRIFRLLDNELEDNKEGYK